jgi:AcrR family transcriptional regulator
MEGAVKTKGGDGRRGRPSEGAREALVAAARELFIERDYDHVSIDEILERSRVSRGALYHHFPAKLDLFRAVWEASERRLIEELAAQVPVSSSPFDVLVGLARAYLHAAETDEELRRIGLGQARSVFGWEAWREAAGEIGLGVALAVVRAAIEAGELPEEDPEAVTFVIYGALLEAAMLIVTDEDPRAARERAEPVVAAVLEGLRR